MRLDILIRLIPLTLAPLVFSWFTGTPLASFGLSLRHPLRDVLVSVPLGLAGFAIAAAFANYLARRSGRWFVPTAPDLALELFEGSNELDVRGRRLRICVRAVVVRSVIEIHPEHAVVGIASRRPHVGPD